MNKHGFTYVEMVCALIVITILVSVSLYFIHPKFSYAKKKSFINQANIVVNAAINKYTSDSSDDDDGYPDDLYEHNELDDKYFGKVCYSLKSLKDKYLKKIDSKYQGSVEICYLSTCSYKTKLWLSNDEYYVDGVKGEISRKNLTSNVLGINHCGNIYN